MSHRDLCLREKGDECTICSSTQNVQVHHVDGDRRNNSLDNLEPVCSACHAKIHSGELEEWHSKILPQTQRTRNLTLRADPEFQRKLEIIQQTSNASTPQEAIEVAVSEERTVWTH